MSIFQRGKTWYIYINNDGQRIRQSAHTQDKAKAQAIHDELKVSLRVKKESGKTLSDAIKLWLQHEQRTPSEISALRCTLKEYPSRPLSQVNGHDIQDALSSKSASTYNRMANNIRSALIMAHKRGWCDVIHIPRKKVTSKKLRFLTQAEWLKLEKELATHVKPLAQFAISTGLRQANVFNLKWSEVDIDRGVAWIDSAEAKGNRSITIPLSKYALNVLEAQKGKHDVYVFVYKDNPLGSVKTSFNKSLKRAGITNFRWHDFRHTWASWHVQNGTPLAVLKELGGWADVNMVMRYAHLSPEHLSQYADNSSGAVFGA